MMRSVIAVTVVVGACACGSRGADDKDPIKDKLFAARATYDKEVAQYKKTAEDWFAKREEAARNDGNRKLFDQCKEERVAFDQSGDLPKGAPAAIAQKRASARKAMEAAYAQAVKDYTKAKKEEDAAVYEKELLKFRLGDGLLFGTWSVTYKDYKGEWTFKENGTVDSSTDGAGAGKWTLDANKGQVLIKWKNDSQDKFDLPLSSKKTTGAQVGRMNTKFEAAKIK